MEDVGMVGLTERDRQIMEMMSEFGGKTFIDVLSQTHWYGLKVPGQQARDRVQKLMKKYKLLRLAPTGLIKPRNAVAMTAFGKEWAKDELAMDVPNLFLSPVTIWHGIFEQITWYWLKRAGRNVSRTIVKRWSIEHKHTPDLLYFHNEDENKPVYVEIETNAKTKDRYLKIFENMKRDKVYRVLYVFENEKKMKSIGSKLPINDKIMLITVEDLINNVHMNGKIGAVKQIDFLKSLNKE